jgi:hypothetical protein
MPLAISCSGPLLSLKPGESPRIIVSFVVEPAMLIQSILTGHIYLVSDYMKGLVFTATRSLLFTLRGPICD